MTSAIVAFLTSDGRDEAGRTIEAVLAFGDVELERHHDFIQWLFPLNEPSAAVPGSPVLTAADIAAIRTSDVAQARLAFASERMLAFYRATTHWRRSSDHNHLRVTRIIKSLRLLAGDPAADAFKAVMLDMAEGAGVGALSVSYWRAA